jgi:hypothetical protein
LSRPRGERRIDRPKDRERLIALGYDVWHELIQISMRLPFDAPHYRQIHPVIIEVLKLLEALGEQPIKPHSIKCGQTRDIDEPR